MLAPPPVRVVEAALSFLDQAAVGALCRVGVPDVLDRAMSVVELAQRLQVDADGLGRLLWFAAARRWVRFDRRGRVRPTASLAFLSSSHPGGWRAWIDFTTRPEVIASIHALGDAVATGTDSFSYANGSDFFSWMSQRAEASAAFDAAMAAGARLHGLGLAGAIDWRGVRTVCDVGGGTGALLQTLTELRPHLRGTVLDLAHVVDDRPRLDGVDFMAGDAFEHVPAGHDAYLLVNVLHDWSDLDATRLLGSVADAASGNAMVVIVEGERRPRPTDDLTARADLLMLVLAPGGRERSTEDIDRLAGSVGLQNQRTVQLPSADLARVYRQT